MLREHLQNGFIFCDCSAEKPDFVVNAYQPSELLFAGVRNPPVSGPAP